MIGSERSQAAVLQGQATDAIGTTPVPGTRSAAPGPGAIIFAIVLGAFWLGAAGAYTTGKEDGNGRFVVVGCSSWIANFFLRFNGNRDLFLNMMNWLSSDEDLISIRPKEQNDRRLTMNARQMTMIFYESVLAIPLIIVVAGVGVWWRRR